jgi:hypothetical protein
VINIGKAYDPSKSRKLKYLKVKDHKTIKKVKLTQKYINNWDKDQSLIVVIKCRNCNLIHEIRKGYYSYFCTCGRNLLILNAINYLYSNVVFRNKNMVGDKIKCHWWRIKPEEEI